jgi:hypothetical protein
MRAGPVRSNPAHGSAEPPTYDIRLLLKTHLNLTFGRRLNVHLLNFHLLTTVIGTPLEADLAARHSLRKSLSEDRVTCPMSDIVNAT